MDNKYLMTMDLNVLEHLGINLYSNVAAVLSEAVANAWDADAENVFITLDQEKEIITIKDDGIGMSFNDMNDKYLRVGYCRREVGQKTKTPKNRAVMGRKGLGKLSLFSVANIIEIQSAKKGCAPHGCRLIVSDIREKIGQKTSSSYEPQPLRDEEIEVTKGTIITLRDLKRSRLFATEAALKKRIARRFSIIEDSYKFSVFVNDSKITAKDRDDVNAVNFLWRIGNCDVGQGRSFDYESSLPDRLEGWSKESWFVKGWIGTASTPKKLDSKESGNMNGIVVLARGRLFHENILEKINDGRLYTKYVTGQIDADFLDLDNEEDIATSDRQRIKEDDPRYEQLLQFLRIQLNELEKQWKEIRGKRELKKLITESKGIKSWLGTLKGTIKESAEKMLVNLSSLPIEKEDDKKELYRHGILAFERLRIRSISDKLADGIADINNLLTLLADRDALESAMYGDIVKSRLETIKDFWGIVENNEKERVIQKYLFSHLWLLDPSWEKLSNTDYMETRLTSLGLFNNDLTEKEKLCRVDIAYRCISGKHVIIELKKSGRKLSGGELYDQGAKYVKILKKVIHDDKPIEVVFVLGTPPDGDETSIKSLISSITPSSRIVYYDELIQGAQQAYGDYLERLKEVDKLDNILRDI